MRPQPASAKRILRSWVGGRWARMGRGLSPGGSAQRRSQGGARRRAAYNLRFSDTPNMSLEPPRVLDDNPLIAERREKLAALRARAKVPFPNDFKPKDRAAELQRRQDRKSTRLNSS